MGTSNDRRHKNPGRPRSLECGPACQSCGIPMRPNGSDGDRRKWRCADCRTSARDATARPIGRPRQ